MHEVEGVGWDLWGFPAGSCWPLPTNRRRSVAAAVSWTHRPVLIHVLPEQRAPKPTIGCLVAPFAAPVGPCCLPWLQQLQMQDTHGHHSQQRKEIQTRMF